MKNRINFGFSEIFERGLSAVLSNAQDSVSLWCCFLEYLRRRVENWEQGLCLKLLLNKPASTCFAGYSTSGKLENSLTTLRIESANFRLASSDELRGQVGL